jgi:hypothetical protein
MAGYTFSPASLPVTVNGANVTGINFVATAFLAKNSKSDLAGTWSMHKLGTNIRNRWQFMTLTIDASGNLTGASLCLDSTGNTTCPDPNSLRLTIDSNGVISESGDSTSTSGHLTLTENKNFIVGSSTNGDGSDLIILQKVVPETVYSSADLQNQPFVYHALSIGSECKWTYGTATTDESGALTLISQTDPSGTSAPGATGAALSVNGNGTVTMSGGGMTSFNGFLSDDKKTIVGTYTDSTSHYQLMIMQITGQIYSAGAIPAGTSVVHFLASGASAFWVHATYTTDNTGGITFSNWVSSNTGVVAPTTPYTGALSSSGVVTITGNPSYHGQMSNDGKFMVGTQTVGTNNNIYSLVVHTR